MIDRLVVDVLGRPAPQGSKQLGQYGQMRESSVYLPAWRGDWVGSGARRRYRHGAVGRAVFEAYRELGIEPNSLPLYGEGEPVIFGCVFRMHPDWGPLTSPPDLDKLIRSTWDALTAARVWKDDGQVVLATRVAKRHETERPGALITVTPATMGVLR